MERNGITFVVAHKNRSCVHLEDGSILHLFPNMIKSLSKSVIESGVKVRMIIGDYGDDTFPLEDWIYQEAIFPVEILKIELDNEKFNKGKALNICIETIQDNECIFICDTDMLITKSVLEEIFKHTVCLKKAFSPICWSYGDASHEDGWWRDTGAGMISFFKSDWAAVGGVWEKSTWGSEDWDFYKKIEKVRPIVRHNSKIFHQWHPQFLGHI